MQPPGCLQPKRGGLWDFFCATKKRWALGWVVPVVVHDFCSSQSQHGRHHALKSSRSITSSALCICGPEQADSTAPWCQQPLAACVVHSNMLKLPCMCCPVRACVDNAAQVAVAAFLHALHTPGLDFDTAACLCPGRLWLQGGWTFRGFMGLEALQVMCTVCARPCAAAVLDQTSARFRHSSHVSTGLGVDVAAMYVPGNFLGHHLRCCNHGFVVPGCMFCSVALAVEKLQPAILHLDRTCQRCHPCAAHSALGGKCCRCDLLGKRA